MIIHLRKINVKIIYVDILLSDEYGTLYPYSWSYKRNEGGLAMLSKEEIESMNVTTDTVS